MNHHIKAIRRVFEGVKAAGRQETFKFCQNCEGLNDNVDDRWCHKCLEREGNISHYDEAAIKGQDDDFNYWG